MHARRLREALRNLDFSIRDVDTVLEEKRAARYLRRIVSELCFYEARLAGD
jgi:hypothetical protein